ncbi:MAG: transporter substrate-binding protein [Solimicrobium sp.]|jgi:putative ABC transport system substrate-binding protein|nr:transporter substrate-binding protein [Solimicrobium sp.]
MKIKNFSYISLLAITYCASMLTSSAFAQDPVKSVSMITIVDHPALEAVQEGVKQELKTAGYEVGKNLKIQAQTAQGNTATAAQIARKFVGDRADVIVAISTPSAQAVAVATKDIPIVFSAVADPIAAGLVKSTSAGSGTNISGVADTVAVEKQLDIIKRGAPNVKRIGVIYNPGEANSASFVKALKGSATAYGYTVVASAAPRSVDVSSAARNLVGKVDLFFASTDSTLVTALAALIKVADEAKIPVFAGDTLMVKQGAAFGLGLNYLDIGRQTGKIVVRVLKGEAVGSIAPQSSANLDLHVNLSAAKRQGLILSDSFLKSAKVVER